MRPIVNPPLRVKGAEFGGPKPLFCVPLVAKTADDLISQAEAALNAGADLVEWRSDAMLDVSAAAMVTATEQLRKALPRHPILFTLRSSTEGGLQPMSQADRAAVITKVIDSRLVELVDVELANGREFTRPIMESAQRSGVSVILSFHDFEKTPDDAFLLETISEMVEAGADIAKIACMPRDASDALRLLQVTFAARMKFPKTPLCTMSMGAAGSLTRVAGFLYGSDMAFAVGQKSSAPGQIPIAEARKITEALLQYASTTSR